MSADAAKLAAANTCLATFAPETSIKRLGGGWYVQWLGHGQVRPWKRRWQCRGQDFYPTWLRKWGHGGTAATALSQLIRWCADKPVFPIFTWRYWASDTVQLLPEQAVDALLAAGYPEHVACVLCGEQISGDLDWWHLDGVSGPCCTMRSGCQQRGRRGGER